MECLYLSDLDINQNEIIIDNEEFHHLKVLRINQEEKILCSNGKGTIAELQIKEITNKKATAKITNYKFIPKNKNKLGIALGILDNKDRFEFALEKCVELGVSDFYPIISKFSQKKYVNLNRLELKSISALKQSKQYWKIKIHQPILLKDIFKTDFDNFYFADLNSNSKVDYKSGDNIIIIGPEGGFSDEEIQLLYSNQICSFTLGHNILRAETAAICSISIFNYISNNL